MDIVFTDLDGTLLDAETYAWDAALPALDRLDRLGIPWIPVTSKTRAEVEWFRSAAGHRHPFIVENGGAAYVPPGCARRSAGEVAEWGTPYPALVAGLRHAATAAACEVRGFHDMTVPEIAAECALPVEAAARAKQREYDEPFLVMDDGRAVLLAVEIEEAGFQWTRGGRFWHILGANDKAVAVRHVRALYEEAYGPVRAIGLGDGLNDAPFLKEMDDAVLVRSAYSVALQALVPLGTRDSPVRPGRLEQRCIGTYRRVRPPGYRRHIECSLGS